MTLTTQDLLNTLKQHPNKRIEIELPNGQLIPRHFHLTEIGYVEKHFIDCGGTKRQQKHLQIQLWVAEDTHHRIDATKWLKILDLSQSILPPEKETAKLEVWFEYQTDLTSQYSLQDILIQSDHLTLKTTGLKTQCLAAQKLERNDCSTSSCCG